MMISPRQAREWLINSRQQKLEMQHIILYANDMINNDWNNPRKTKRPHPIKIQKHQCDKREEPINGHHRLFAIILANKPMDLDVNYVVVP